MAFDIELFQTSFEGAEATGEFFREREQKVWWVPVRSDVHAWVVASIFGCGSSHERFYLEVTVESCPGFFGNRVPGVGVSVGGDKFEAEPQEGTEVVRWFGGRGSEVMECHISRSIEIEPWLHLGKCIGGVVTNRKVVVCNKAICAFDGAKHIS